MTLAVRRMPSPHTGENIRQLVDHILTEWDIALQKVAAVNTDNGSHMLAAFKTHFESERMMTTDLLVKTWSQPTLMKRRRRNLRITRMSTMMRLVDTQEFCSYLLTSCRQV